MSNPYRKILAAPGAASFTAAGFFGRMTLSMMGVGMITLVSQVTGRYGLAGALAATFALAAAAIGPQTSRLVDRHGQARVLRPVTLVAVAAVAGFLLCLHRDAQEWALFLFAAGIGCAPNVGSMVKARWAEVHQGSPRDLHTAYSWEAVVDEVCYIVGPIVSIGLSIAWFPQAGVVLAGGFLSVGVLWLTAQRGTEPAPHPRAAHDEGSALRSRGLQVLVATYVAIGAVFGSVDVVTVAFAEERGHKGAASLVLAAYAIGSCAAGVVLGLVHLKGPPFTHWFVGVCAMAATVLPLLFVTSLWLLAPLLFLAGLCIAPTMITAMPLLERHVPRSKFTEGMSWTGTGLAVGLAVGSAVSGRVVDSSGAESGYVVPCAAGAMAVVVALVGGHHLRAPAEKDLGGFA
ncbi:MFS transporter [Streptomyces spectabilis]|uniref:MFS family permease n=1 Tax=Streptomyces spectabilis TaxID=68270 RepID=A0A5P2XH31_STRST|nr:MFS transporter [Streptomyces spectabilis]MBB5102021.1 MFS family permease [Streptomyces spectabilis]MCI3907072.1 MFS transporter [Streptomyces spectabilis]QEV63841.1 MFS transporter [Streptomyces spectabilis]GGV35718.1 MFS transporter [Streptomyces spectabilis]